MEEKAAAEDGSIMATYVLQLVSRVRALEHELADPNYQYSGRIHRQAIVSRNALIEKLRQEIAILKKEK